ncbi:MAG: MopE-related protein [bacterium]
MPPDPGEPAAESCNGLDDDCDGDADEAIEAVPCETGQPGVCAAGATACADGATVCQPPTGPSEEICDGLDNDCDGATDEAEDGAPLTRACYDGPEGTAGVGPCLEGTATCVDGTFAACEGQVLPGVERCNDADDDCNGTLDDIDFGVCICRPGAVDACYTGPAGTEGNGPCRGGTWTCADDGTAYGPCVGEVLPAVETCNEIDDDCNGILDDINIGACICRPGAVEGCYSGPAGTEGIGVCVGGTRTCAPDGTAYGPCVGEVIPAAEVCAFDGDDVDCDGAAGCDDADCDDAPGCFEVCDNGVDDDDDGYVDCNDAECAATPACERPNVLVCGAVGWNVATLFAPEDGIAVAAGCAPDATVRALFVTRNGAPQPAWAAYVAEGGRVVTEYNTSAQVFTTIFGEAAPRGGGNGSCYDNVIPAVRANEADPFWQVNGGFPLIPLGETGCGFDMSAYPQITPLGGWGGGTVSLAYRDLGLGRLWLVESDWQDGERTPGRFNAATAALMRAMVIDPFDPKCDRAGACLHDRACVDGICVRAAP